MKSWLAATAGLACAAPALAQNPYPTNFDVEPAGHTAPGLPPVAPPAKPGFALPNDPCKPFTYHDGPPTVPGSTNALLTAADTAKRRAPGTVWASGEYLLWWSRDMGVPPLVTAVPSGAVDGPPTTGFRLYPDARKIDFDRQNGYRVSGGVMVGECTSIEGSFFQLETQVDRGFFAGSGVAGTAGIGRPYNPAGGTPRVLYSALPGQYAGAVDVGASTTLWGVEASLGVDTYHLFADHNRALYGFRFVDLAERITVTDASLFESGRANTVQDVFATRNQFYGGQVGLHSRFFGGSSWTFETIGKLGFGGVNQRVEVFGANANIDPTGVVDREAGGLLARPTNSGVFERDKFAVTLDLTLALGYQITPRLRTTFGYSIFYLSSAMRPGSVIDRTVNDSNIRFVAEADRTASALARPRIDFGRASDYWAQGLNFGLQFGYSLGFHPGRLPMLSATLIDRVLAALPGKTVGLLGDLFLDRYLGIDPALDEPSVETGKTAYQVVGVRSDPGALGTVLNNLCALGVGRVVPVSVIGDDGEGYELRQALAKLPAVDASRLVVTPDRRTPTYCKPMYGSQELNRLDTKNRTPTPAALEDAVLAHLYAAWRECDAWLVLDQVSEPDCGVVTARVRDELAALATGEPARFVLADSRERIGLFRNVCIKPNMDEALNAMTRDRHLKLVEVRGLRAKVWASAVFCTWGPNGIALAAATEPGVSVIPAYPVTGPVDVCGAGDSCAAGIAAAVVAGATFPEAAAFGNLVASVTVQQVGTTGTATPEQVRQRWAEVCARENAGRST
jgi:rfaE bifunctional protein kinase chain/domain